MLLIGIGGGTSSGKSTIAKKLVESFDKTGVVRVLSDSYYKDHSNLNISDRSKINFDHPNAIDFDLLIKNLKDLKKNIKIKEPVYSYKTHKRLKKTKTVVPKKIIILEGLHIFCNKKLVNLIDYGFFLNLDSKTRLLRRINRDVKERGRSITEIKKRYIEMCEPMYKKFIFPSRLNANKVLDMKKVNYDYIKEIINEFI